MNHSPRRWAIGLTLATIAWVIVLLALGSLLLGCGGNSDPLPDVSTPYVNCHKGTCT